MEVINKLKTFRDSINNLYNEAEEASNKKDIALLTSFNNNDLFKQIDKINKIINEVNKNKNKILETRKKDKELEEKIKQQEEEKKKQREERKGKLERKGEKEKKEKKIEEIKLEDYKELIDRIKEKRHYIYSLNEDGDYKLLGNSRSLISLTDKINKVHDYYIFVSLKYNTQEENIRYNLDIRRLKYNQPAPNSYLLSATNTYILVSHKGTIDKNDPELKDAKTDKLLIDELIPTIINKLNDLEQNKVKEIKNRKVVKKETKILSKELFGKALKDLTPEEKRKYEAEKKKRQRMKKKEEEQKEEKPKEEPKKEKKKEEKKEKPKKEEPKKLSKLDEMKEKVISSYESFLLEYIEDGNKVEKLEEKLMDNLNKYLNVVEKSYKFEEKGQERSIEMDNDFNKELDETLKKLDRTPSEEKQVEIIGKSLKNMKDFLKK